MSAEAGTPMRTPGQMIFRWVALSLVGILGAAALVYAGDFAVFSLRGSPVGQVNATRYMAAPLKGDKTEYYYEGSGPVDCAKSLFPQNGMTPCWYLRKHPLYAEKA